MAERLPSVDAASPPNEVNDDIHFEESEMAMIDEVITSLDTTRNKQTPNEGKATHGDNGTQDTTTHGSQIEKPRLSNNESTNASGGQTTTIAYNENAPNPTDGDPMSAEETEEIRDQTRRGQRCYGMYKWVVIGCGLLAYAIYLIVGYVNGESVSTIEFDDITYVDAPFIYTEFMPIYGGLYWVYIDYISYYNKSSKNYESFSFANRSLAGVKYFEFSLNDTNISDIVENYDYSEYSNYWIFIYDEWKGYGKWHKKILIPPKNIAIVTGDSNLLQIVFDGEYVGWSTDSSALLTYVHQHEDWFGFYWSLEDISTFLSNNENSNGKINWKTIEVTRNGWLSFPKNKWFYLLPIKTKSEITGEEFVYYDFRMSSEALTSNVYNISQYFHYLYTYMSLSVDPLAISTSYVESRKYSFTELMAAVGGMYSLVGGFITLFCIHVILRKIYPRAFVFDANMNRSLPNYLKIYEGEQKPISQRHSIAPGGGGDLLT